MNGRTMSRQTSAKQTNAQTQARQLNKQMIESAGRHALAAQIAKTSLSGNGNNAKGNVDEKMTQYSIYESRENLNSFSLSILSEISQTDYVRQIQNSRSNFKNWPSHSLRTLKYAKHGYFALFICELL